MIIRLAKKSDIWIIYNWVNQIDSIKNKLITKTKISRPEHKGWYENSLKNKNRYIWIVEEKHIALGQIRFDIDEEQKLCFIDIYIDKKHRKNNFGQKALYKAIELVKSNSSLNYCVALVLKSNLTSLKFFYSLGFSIYKSKYSYYDLRLTLKKK